ncbi:MAG: hypothetical protein ACM359_08875 [Bacillota bacterium]
MKMYAALCSLILVSAWTAGCSTTKEPLRLYNPKDLELVGTGKLETLVFPARPPGTFFFIRAQSDNPDLAIDLAKNNLDRNAEWPVPLVFKKLGTGIMDSDGVDFRLYYVPTDKLLPSY